MTCRSPQSTSRNRRNVVGLLAAVAASASLLASGEARAAGRHGRSDPAPRPAAPNCLLRGTRVRTKAGQTPVEDLRPGDEVMTDSGLFQPVRWVGRQHLRRTAGAIWPQDVSPVLVRSSAISFNVPARDVRLSPEHALFIDGYLIPVRYLINGDSIVQAEYSSHKIDYFHVECDQHDVILAEGLPVETLLLTSAEAAFVNVSDRGMAFEADRGDLLPYAPCLAYRGGREHALALLRQLVSFVVDLRDPIQIAYDRLAARGRLLRRLHEDPARNEQGSLS